MCGSLMIAWTTTGIGFAFRTEGSECVSFRRYRNIKDSSSLLNESCLHNNTYINYMIDQRYRLYLWIPSDIQVKWISKCQNRPSDLLFIARYYIWNFSQLSTVISQARCSYVSKWPSKASNSVPASRRIESTGSKIIWAFYLSKSRFEMGKYIHLIAHNVIYMCMYCIYFALIMFREWIIFRIYPKLLLFNIIIATQISYT